MFNWKNAENAENIAAYLLIGHDLDCRLNCVEESGGRLVTASVQLNAIVASAVNP